MDQKYLSIYGNTRTCNILNVKNSLFNILMAFFIKNKTGLLKLNESGFL